MAPASSDPYALMYALIASTDSLRNLIVALTGSSRSCFENPSVAAPKLEPAELGFIRMVSWLFVLYFETGRVSTKFLLKKLAVYSMDAEGRLANHTRAVGSLRTLLQHHLEFNDPRDAETREVCHKWYSGQCGTAVPDNDGHWKDCLVAIAREGLEFLQALAAVARRIEADESRETICEQWKSKLGRYRTPRECENFVSKIASDMARDYLDVRTLTQRHHQGWIKELELLSFDSEVDVALRRLIETAILSDVTTTLPITGEDVMAYFGLPPGRQVGDLLRLANKLFAERQSNGDELLARLRDAGNLTIVEK